MQISDLMYVSSHRSPPARLFTPRSSPGLRLHDLMASASLGVLSRSERQVGARASVCAEEVWKCVCGGSVEVCVCCSPRGATWAHETVVGKPTGIVNVWKECE